MITNRDPLESFQTAVSARRIVAKLTEAKVQSQLKDLEKAFDLMTSLLRKVENADSAAKKKFDSAYSKIGTIGTALSKDAAKFLGQTSVRGTPDQEAAKDWVLDCNRDWTADWNRYQLAKREIQSSKILDQAGHSYGYATKLGEALLMAGKENLL